MYNLEYCKEVGSSAFGIVITQRADNQIQIMHAEEYQRPDFNQMLSVVWDLFRRFGKINKIYIDGSNPSFIRALKIQIGEDEEYEEIIKVASSVIEYFILAYQVFFASLLANGIKLL